MKLVRFVKIIASVSLIRKILPQFSHFSLALLLSILANGVFFFHTHELDNGIIITHAHPLLTDEHQELPDHGHTESELITLDFIAHADYLIHYYSVDIPKDFTFDTESEEYYTFQGYFKLSTLGFDHRGPPTRFS
jgi:hypothetical protein